MRVPGFLCPSNHVDAAEGRLLEKEPSNLQAQSLSGLIEDRATRGECLSNTSRHSLMHSPRWIHWNGHRRRSRSSWCFAAHEFSKAGGAQIAQPTAAFLMPSFSSCFRVAHEPERLPMNIFHFPSPFTPPSPHKLLGSVGYFTINHLSPSASRGLPYVCPKCEQPCHPRLMLITWCAWTPKYHLGGLKHIEGRTDLSPPWVKHKDERWRRAQYKHGGLTSCKSGPPGVMLMRHDPALIA